MFRPAAIIGLAGLIASILGFAAALIVTIDRAESHFRRAELAQTQFAAVLRIAHLVETGDRTATPAALTDYRQLIVQERRLRSPSDRAELGAEARMAARLIALAGRPEGPTARAEIDRIVAATVTRERREALVEAAAMAALRVRAWWLTGALMLAAIGSAVLGSAGLFLANRRLTREVARRTAEIAAIDASRRLFFAKASHELRTPVTVMRGEAEVALGQPGGEIAALRHVVAQAEFLDHRIAELLALAQAEDGQLRLVFEPCDLGEIAVAAGAAVAGFARSNEVWVAIDRDAACRISGDPRWLAQAMIAVLDNAIRFSSAGGAVRVAVRGCVVSIADDGIGLLPEAVPRIFDAFYQVDNDAARGGSGLGLALARWVIERHKGEIVAANLEGGGCVVTMTLPVLA